MELILKRDRVALGCELFMFLGPFSSKAIAMAYFKLAFKMIEHGAQCRHAATSMAKYKSEAERLNVEAQEGPCGDLPEITFVPHIKHVVLFSDDGAVSIYRRPANWDVGIAGVFIESTPCMEKFSLRGTNAFGKHSEFTGERMES